jgi:hypothetical protein
VNVVWAATILCFVAPPALTFTPERLGWGFPVQFRWWGEVMLGSSVLLKRDGA